MPNQADRSTSRDFAFQSADQAFVQPLEGAEAPVSTTGLPQLHVHYEADQTSNTHSASSAPLQPLAQDASLSYPDFAPHPPSLQSQTPGQFPHYSFSAGPSLAWDWDGSAAFPGFPSNYEPQGELVQELQNQAPPTNDFSIPLPVTATDNAFQSPLSLPNSTPANAQKPLSAPPKPPAKPAVQTGMKRKADSEPNSAVAQTPNDLQQGPAKRMNKSRSSSSASITSPSLPNHTASASATDTRRSSMAQVNPAATAPESAVQSGSSSNNELQRKKEQSKGTGPQGRVIDVSKPRKIVEVPGGHDILPAGKVFPIQIGSELFRLSGASISSDAPSYFSHFFSDQLHSNSGRAGDVRTLYIDRDPETFRDIALHLQGYHIEPRNGEHFVKLFADAQFYSLPRFTKQLFNTDIFIRIGSTPFQIPRELFSAPGDSPNYFSLGFAQFFSTPSEVFPGLDRNALLRPPSMAPPKVPNRSGETFAELIKMLQGYNIEIRNEAHRSTLLRDARYFHLKGLEQRLIPCDISYNLARSQSEILIRLEDIRQSGVSFTPDGPNSSSNSGSASAHSAAAISPATSNSKASSPVPSFAGAQQTAGSVSYARPYTDDHSNTNILILEIAGSEHTTLHFPSSARTVTSASAPLSLNVRATFNGTALARITSLFGVIASKMGLPATQPLGLMMLQSGGGVAAQPVSPANSGVSERRVRVHLDSSAYLEIDGSPVELAVNPDTKRIGIRRSGERVRKRARSAEDEFLDNVTSSDDDWVWGGPKSNDAHLKAGEEPEDEWVIKRAHWRLRVEPMEGEGGRMQVVLCGVRLEGFSVEKSRNRSRGFLGA